MHEFPRDVLLSKTTHLAFDAAAMYQPEDRSEATLGKCRQPANKRYLSVTRHSEPGLLSIKKVTRSHHDAPGTARIGPMRSVIHAVSSTQGLGSKITSAVSDDRRAA